jgi:hypothetical protein
MEFLQNQNGLVLLAGCCVALFVFGGIIGFILQIFGFGFGIIINFVNVVLGVITGGPLAWCGCILVIFGCAGCGVVTLAVAQVLPRCGTAQAVNLCKLFGY